MASRPTRRGLIFGGAALAAASAVCAGVVVKLPEPGPGRRVLSERECFVVGRLADAIWPEGNPIGVSAVEADVVAGVDELLADTLGSDQGTAFRQIVRALDAAVDVESPDLLERMQAWQGPEELFKRVATDGIKAVLGLAYFNHPRVLDAVGFDSRCHR